jgi:hypothetical protein
MENAEQLSFPDDSFDKTVTLGESGISVQH